MWVSQWFYNLFGELLPFFELRFPFSTAFYSHFSDVHQEPIEIDVCLISGKPQCQWSWSLNKTIVYQIERWDNRFFQLMYSIAVDPTKSQQFPHSIGQTARITPFKLPSYFSDVTQCLKLLQTKWSETSHWRACGKLLWDEKNRFFWKRTNKKKEDGGRTTSSFGQLTFDL